ncbi:metallo-beta-lactamase domain protein [Lawsonibacter asaccharolyticus]|jgi:metallo-beta-lactamase class B|nr:metallo-beta-lactamase domain protein [Lawsonibacter asaccharolyticus]
MTKREERQAAMGQIMHQRFHEPWTLAQKPFKVIENVYFVGNTWVSVYLIDTPEGLILIDCAYEENLYLLIDSIRGLGFDPKDIRHLLISHGHFDHCGAARQLQEMSNCEIWINEKDAYFFTERRDLIAFEDRVPEFRIDHYYDSDQSICFGGMTIWPVPCPGHTPGTTSFFFEVEHEGRKLTVAMHGGLGTNTLSKEDLLTNGWPLSFQQGYLDMLRQMKRRSVDVLIPSHAGHAKTYPFFDIAAQDDGTGNGFIRPNAWREMLEIKEQEMLALLEREAERK